MRGEPVRLERGSEGEALVVSDPAFLGSLKQVAPEFGKRVSGPAGRRRIYIVSAAAVTVAALAGAVYLWGVPALSIYAASRVPPKWEKGLGDSMLSFIAPLEHRMEERSVIVATARIAGRLNSVRGESEVPCHVVVVRRPLVNAYALPGGCVVLNSGLIGFTKSAEELAGVLAHEIQHVRRRHVTRSLIQRVSGGLLAAALVGDISGALAFGVDSARVMLDLRYSRAAEREADFGAVGLLEEAGIDPAGLPAFLSRMMRERPDHTPIPAYLATHPKPEERVKQILKQIECERHYGPFLPDIDWAAIRSLCAEIQEDGKGCPRREAR